MHDDNQTRFPVWAKKTIAGALTAVALAWSTWVSATLMTAPTKNDVTTAVQSATGRIDTEIRHSRSIEGRILDSLDNNTEALNQMSVRLAELRAVLRQRTSQQPRPDN